MNISALSKIIVGLSSAITTLGYNNLIYENQGYIQSLIYTKGVEIISNKKMETNYPGWAKPDPHYQHSDSDYRINKVLPYEEDRNLSAYLVYPKVGIITPIIPVNKEDNSKLKNGELFDHLKYLTGGALHYIGRSPDVGPDNMVIAAHSAFDTDYPGKYKTVFQALALSDTGDYILYFQKDGSFTYHRYVYKITHIGKININDTSILYPIHSGYELTTYTCYPFGSSEYRYFNKAIKVE